MFSYIQRSFFVVLCLLWLANSPVTKAVPLIQKAPATQGQLLDSIGNSEELVPAVAATGSHDTTDQADLPPIWLVVPFVVLLLMIATGPLLYEKFWDQHYPKVAMLLAVLVLAYYLLVLHDWGKPVEALAEYVQFIALIAALYTTSGGILIAVNRRATPLTNLGVLFTGAVMSNLIGTTGASMLLIRPI
jgi:hypothetical protein